MTEGKTRAEVAAFEALIADPEEKERMVARQNQIAQEELQRRMGMMGPPRKPPPRKSNQNGN